MALLSEIRFAARRIRKSPGFSAIVVATLALGIGANTAIFSVVNTVLLRALPYHEPERLATVFHFYPSLNDLEAPVSAPGFRDYQGRKSVFVSAAVQSGWAPTLTGAGEPERLNGSRVSGDWFTTLGVPTLIGRALRPDEDEPGRNRVIVLSYGLWQRMFGGDRSIASSGRTLTLNGEPYEIVGVMGPEFRDFWNRDAQLWTPLALAAANFTDNNRTTEFLPFTGRFAPGMTVEAAQREMSAFAEQLKRDYPNNYGSQWSLKVRALNEQSTGRVKTLLLVLLGAVGFVLLIACANVANLMLVRAASRHREVVIRTALGASRGQLVRQLLTESVLLALGGGILAVGLAFAGIRALVRISPQSLPRSDEISLDPTTLVFTLLLAIVTGIAFGLIPALQTSRANLQETLREGGWGSTAARRGNRVRRGLVVAQVALALTLLTGAGLLIKSFARLSGVDPGFTPDRLLTFNLALPAYKYVSDTSWRAYFDDVLPRIAAVPGVQSVAATSTLPFGGSWSTGSFAVEGYQPPTGQPGPWGDIRVVTPGFFETMGMRVLAGRTFTVDDRAGGVRVAVIDDELARRFWPGESAVGKRVTRGAVNDSTRWIEIIGVVNHSAHEGLDAPARVQLYFPFAQFPLRNMTLAVRTSATPIAVTSAVRQAVQSVDKDQPLARVETMDRLMANATGQRRLAMTLLAEFAALALVLAAIGIYGVIAHTVAQRSQELGIRMALGAGRNNVLALVLRQGMLLVSSGIVVGVLGSLGLTRLVRAQLYGVGPRDPVTFVVIVLLLATVAFIATLIPAARATRVDPVTVLRTE
jgi:putative ABC transport system permease protein